VSGVVGRWRPVLPGAAATVRAVKGPVAWAAAVFCRPVSSDSLDLARASVHHVTTSVAVVSTEVLRLSPHESPSTLVDGERTRPADEEL
jgi:acyl-coenzyme A thioesterase PaaI-like protein